MKSTHLLALVLHLVWMLQLKKQRKGTPSQSKPRKGQTVDKGAELGDYGGRRRSTEASDRALASCTVCRRALPQLGRGRCGRGGTLLHTRDAQNGLEPQHCSRSPGEQISST